MSQGLLVLILSIVVFVAGALFINYSVKHDEAKEKQAQQAASKTAKDMKKAA